MLQTLKNKRADTLGTFKSRPAKINHHGVWISENEIWNRHGTTLLSSEVDFRKSVADILLRPYTRVDPSKTHALSDLQRDMVHFAHKFTQKSTEKLCFLKFPTSDHERI